MERPTTAPVSRKLSRSQDKKPARASSAVVAAKRNAILQQQELNMMLQQSENKTITDFIQDIYKNIRESKEMVSTKTGIIYDESMTEHLCPWDPNYPECPERFSSVLARCKELNLLSRTTFITPRHATKEELMTRHNIEHIDKLEKTSGLEDIEKLEDFSSHYDAVYVHPTTYELARLSAGCAIELVDAVCTNKVGNGMAIIRPPGHHAMSNEYCGYCLFNNVALAAHHAIHKHKLNRILIVDWDVHHGQATQQMFYDDPKVLYVSLHRFENGTFWPNLRESDFDYIGKESGRGFNINIPLNSTGMNDIDYLNAWHHILMPIATEFQPELVLVSAGYDAALGCPEFNPQLVLISAGFDSAIGDEKGLMNLSPALYAHLTHMLLSLANGKVCVLLEGGYCLRSLAEGAALTLRSLLGDPCPQLETLDMPNQSMWETIWDVANVHYTYWKNLRIWPTTIKDVNSNCLKSPSKTHHTISKFCGESIISDRYETRNCYPVPDQEFIQRINRMLDNLITNCDLSIPEKRVVYGWHEGMLQHKNLVLVTHPEKPERITSIIEKLQEFNILERCTLIPARIATSEEIMLVHSSPLLDWLRQISTWEDEQLIDKQKQFKSIYLHSKTAVSAGLAAGTLLGVTDEVLSGKSRSGVAVIRPPGHHAEPDNPCGFCIFNNISIAAKYAIKKYKLERLLILDWDIHHGNGTQMVFEDDPQVLYISIHRYENASFFPNSKKANYTQVGTGAGQGFNVNIPWNKRGLGDREYMAAFHRLVMPIAYAFNPQLVLVSAGFDAADGDPLGGCKVTPEAFGHMTHLLSSLAGGRIILALEGGYNTETISYCMTACFKALLGDPLLPLSFAGSSSEIQQSAINTIRNVAKTHSLYWPCLKILDVKIALKEIFNETNVSQTAKSVDQPEFILNQLADLKIKLINSDQKGKQAPNSSDTNKENNDANQSQPGASGSSSSDSNAASGSSTKPVQSLPEYLNDNIQMLASGQMFAVVPLNNCPHLPMVQRVPETGIDPSRPCVDCGSQQENWICLICYEVFCGRFINQHMIDHSNETGHPLTLSFSDLSVWCYLCEAYIDNMALYEARNALHIAKFGKPLPWTFSN